MRIVVKGGVWKNTEDEILKAAIMKYGKNQWARVASLLPRKTTSQCKARWYEWLDPSIKKTEWSREEDEKLLHLAKLMPAQWRTIAPMVGRTAAQCLARYERLLDEAQGRSIDARDDPRRLRPGEVDPHPETKPARPDPVDMDEDEKEMLAEARARLANTRGKKAKRKAREKKLEEARRLADLQKRRELKAAGINVGIRKRPRRGDSQIDYEKEIPFEKSIPAGFYDTSREDTLYEKQKEKADFQAIKLQDLEEERRDDEIERQRKKDAEKLKKQAAHNLPAVIDKLSAANDPMQYRKRSRLALPAPQITDNELREISKMSTNGALANIAAEGSEATSALLGDYSASAAARTPAQRTSRTPSRKDTIMQEARNLVALNAADTPLLGGENHTLEEGTGFAGIAPTVHNAQTPNALLSVNRANATPGVHGAGATPGNASIVTKHDGGVAPTPIRDSLNINKSTGAANSVGTHNRVLASNQTVDFGATSLSPAELKARLSQLPEPKYEYDILAAPEGSAASKAANEQVSVETVVEDQEEIDKRAEAARRAAEEAEFRRRSSALQRKPPLPRPLTIDETIIAPPVGANPSPEDLAASLIQEEIVAMLQHDNAKWPVKKSKSKHVPVLQQFTDQELAAAKTLLQKEIDLVQSEAGPIDVDLFHATWQENHQNLIYVPSLGRHEVLSGLSRSEKLEGMQHTFEQLSAAVQREKKRVEKMQTKMGVLIKGYHTRSQKLHQQRDESFQAARTTEYELATFARLLQDEKLGIMWRTTAAEEELRQSQEKSKTLQARYQDLQRQIRELKAQL